MKMNLIVALLLVVVSSCSKTSSTPQNPPPTTGKTDAALVADWKQSYTSTIEIDNGPGGNTSTPSGYRIDFTFNANGTYTQEFYNQSSLGCTIIIYGSAKGNWHVDDTKTVYLDETYYYLKTTDECNSAYNSEKNPPLKHIKYAYDVVNDDSGKPNLHLQTTSGDDVYYQ